MQLTPLSMLQAFEGKLLTLPQEEVPVVHYYPKGLYGRRMHQKAGVVVVGKMHRLPHMVVLLAGRISVVTDGFREDLEAPLVFTSDAGSKRAIYAHTDCDLMTVHPNPNDLSDEDELEEYLIAPHQDEVELMKEINLLNNMRVDE